MHPRVFIKRGYLEPFNIGAKDLAERLRVSESVISRILNAKSSITPTMALKLSKVIGRSPESWLAMQDNFDLWEARQKLSLDDFEKLEVA